MVQVADQTFPEGLGRRTTVPRVAAAAALTIRLLVNAKEAIDELWVQRGYGKWKASKWITLLHPDEIQAKLGYRLDREEAVGVLVAWSLRVPLQTDEHARAIGKRVGSIVGPISVKLKALRRRGESTASQCAALLDAPASLNLSPPPKKPGTSAAAPLPPPPPLDPASPLKKSRRAPPPPLQFVPGQCSQEMMAACDAALTVEAATRTFEEWLRIAEEASDDDFSLDDDEDYQEDEMELDIRTLEYKRTLQRLARAQPELGIVPEADCNGHAASGPLCSCESGLRVAGPGYPPWLLQTEALGFCFERLGECDWEGWELRCDVMKGYKW